jgi:hypothetical protein
LTRERAVRTARASSGRARWRRKGKIMWRRSGEERALRRAERKGRGAEGRKAGEG